MPYCEACGKELRLHAAFCSACGGVASSGLAATGPGAPSRAVVAAAWPAPHSGSPATTFDIPAGMVLGDWLVVIGGLVYVLGGFIWLQAWHYPGTPWVWEHVVSSYWWTSYWSSVVHPWGTSQYWVWLLITLACHVASVLCVVAVIQALRRGLGSASVSVGLVRSWGIVAALAAAGYVAYIVLSAPDGGGRSIPANSIVSLAGAVLIIVGAGQMPGSAGGRVLRSAAGPVPVPVGAPGIGIAGFVLSLLGFSVPGLVLSWVGYAKATRESRPSGLCLAGIILGLIGTVIVVLLTIFEFAMLAAMWAAVFQQAG